MLVQCGRDTLSSHMTRAEAIQICRDPERSVRDAKRVIKWAEADPSPDTISYLLLLNSNAFAAVNKLYAELESALVHGAASGDAELWDCLERDWAMDRHYAAIDALLKLSNIDKSRVVQLANGRLASYVWGRIQAWAQSENIEIPPDAVAVQEKCDWELSPEGVRSGSENIYADLAKRKRLWPAEKDLAPPSPKRPSPRSSGYGEGCSELTDILARIQGSFERLAPALAHKLRPPSSAEEIAGKGGEIPFTLPEEVYELYRWHDGMEGVNGFIAHFDFMSLSASIDYYKSTCDFPGFRKQWFPLFDFNGEEVICVVCGKNESVAGRIIVLDYESGSRELAGSLTAFLRGIYQQYESGSYVLNEHGALIELRSV